MSKAVPLTIEEMSERLIIRDRSRIPTILVSNGVNAVEVPVSNEVMAILVDLMDGATFSNPEGDTGMATTQRKGTTTIPQEAAREDDSAGGGWEEVDDEGIELPQSGEEEDG